MTARERILDICHSMGECDGGKGSAAMELVSGDLIHPFRHNNIYNISLVAAYVK